MTTMKAEKHKMHKEIWIKRVRDQKESGLSIRQWCRDNDLPESMYYYWLRVIRQESLIQAGTLAVTGKTEFVELKPINSPVQIQGPGCRAIIKADGFDIEIYDGISPELLQDILKAAKES